MSSSETLLTTLPEALGRRTRRATARAAVAAARREYQATLAATAAYCGGLPAEECSSRKIREAALADARRKVREACCGRWGRPIDLAGLLRQRRPDGMPRWTLADPARPIGGREGNGTFDTDGTICIGNAWVRFFESREDFTPRAFRPDGIPPLPPLARRCATGRNVRRRACWVGLLFEPEGWTEVRPDPAIVVEWKALPGRYFALCVWGGDFPRIMEFVS